jgi:hypothetical protein
MKNRAMLRFLFAFVFVSFSVQGFAQFGYETFSKTDGLELSTKWGTAKDEDGERKPALLLGIANENAHAVSFSFDVNLYYEGILRETGRIEGYCVEAGKKRIGKLNGIFFIPEHFTEEQLNAPDFTFSLDAVEVTPEETCETDEN